MAETIAKAGRKKRAKIIGRGRAARRGIEPPRAALPAPCGLAAGWCPGAGACGAGIFANMNLSDAEWGLGWIETGGTCVRALVIGASGGIGQALVAALAGDGAEVVGLSRRRDGLDVTDEASVRAVLGRLEGPFDTVFIATGALEIAGHRPEKTLRGLEPAALALQFAVNAMGPVLVLKHLLALLPRERAVRVGVLSARVGSIGDNRLGGWYSYRAAKAALNQLVHSAAIEVARSHPLACLVLLHPGTVATPFTAAYAGGHATVAAPVAARHLIGVLAGLEPAQSGGFYDWSGKAVVW